MKPHQTIGKLHRFANDHDEPVVFTVEARPAGRLVKAFQLAYGIANKLYFIRLSQGYLATVPLFLQKLFFGVATFYPVYNRPKTKP